MEIYLSNNENIILKSISDILSKKLSLLEQMKVMSLSPVDNDVTSVSHMLDMRDDIINNINNMDLEIYNLINGLNSKRKTLVKNILEQQGNEEVSKENIQNEEDYILDIDNFAQKIYNILGDIALFNDELNTKLSFIRENLVIQIKQINNNNQIFKYSNSTISTPIGSVMDTKQ